MNELYWINVLGGIKIFAVTALITFSIILAVCIAMIIGDTVEEATVKDIKSLKKITFRLILPIFIVVLFLSIAVPSKSSMLSIYGFGTTIDYLQNSDEAKELPDNAIKAMNV